MNIDAKDLNRGLRATLWPAIKAHGFTARTDRVAWRYQGDDIDVIELQAVGQSAEVIGCPPLSLSVVVCSYLPFMDRTAGRLPMRNGKSRPHYWHCDPFRIFMQKTIAQPWFRPFSQPRDKRTLLSFRLHRDALRRLVDRSVHDVPDIWYIREDGSNLDESLLDLTRVVLSAGLDLLDQFHDPRRVYEMIENGSLLNAESPHAQSLKRAIETYLAGRPTEPLG
jgi:hypothetical protein